MNNYISLNIKFLCERESLTQNEFGELFGLKRSVIATYMAGTMPKIETIQRICEHFNLSIDDFINTEMRTGKGKKNYPISDNASIVAESGSYETGVYIIEKLEAQLKDKQLIIDMQRERIKELEGKLDKVSGKQQAG